MNEPNVCNVLGDGGVDLRILSSEEASPVIAASTLRLSELLAGTIDRKTIERCFQSQGCGAALVCFDTPLERGIYDRFYTLQSAIHYRQNTTIETDTEFSSLDRPVSELLYKCALQVARLRAGCSGPPPQTLVDREMESFQGLACRVGRPLDACRKEFHPAASFLLEQEKNGSLQCESPVIEVVKRGKMGPRSADEVRLLAIYREWLSASVEEQNLSGGKYNGDIYYHGFRGKMHFDAGGTMVASFGPGEICDCNGMPVTTNPIHNESRGTLMVQSPYGDGGARPFVALPMRLLLEDDLLPYVVIFFKAPFRDCDAQRVPPLVDLVSLGWKPTFHGVQRMANPEHSRGQVVFHVDLLSTDLNIKIHQAIT
jgi:hypothetical protein